MIVHNPYHEDLTKLNPKMSSFSKLEDVQLTVFVDKHSVVAIAAWWLLKSKPGHFDQKDRQLNIFSFEKGQHPWIQLNETYTIRVAHPDFEILDFRGRTLPFILVGTLIISYIIWCFEENGTNQPSSYKITEYEHPDNYLDNDEKFQHLLKK